MDDVQGKVSFVTIKSILALLWHLHLDYAISLLLFYSIMYYNGVNFKKKKNLIMAIEQQSFRDNILALHNHKSKYTFIVFPEVMRTIVGETCWPKELMKETGFYEKKERHRKTINRLENIHYTVLFFITKMTNIEVNVVLAADFDNYQDFPWIAAIHQMKGKFIAYCNENIITKKTKEETTKKLVSHIFRFDGDAILFYNSEAKTIFERLISFEKNKIHVVGEPRIDTLIQMKRGGEDFIAIVTFKEYEKLWNETIDAIYSKKELRKKIVMICKNEEEMQDASKKHQPGAICVKSDLVLKSGPKAIIGINRTECFDAMIVGIPVIVPFWAEAKKTEEDEMELFGNHTRKFHETARTKETLLKLIDSYMNDKKEYPLKPEAREYIEKRYSLIDGNNCKRFFDLVDKICK